MTSVGQESPIRIGKLEFTDPALDNVVIDAWRGEIRLVIGECAPPFTWERPNRVEFCFTGVLEIRSYANGPGSSRGELWEAGERPADTEVERAPDGRIRLTGTAFRKDMGFTWLSEATDVPRLVWLAADVFYIEFIYAGEVAHRVLT